VSVPHVISVLRLVRVVSDRLPLSSLSEVEYKPRILYDLFHAVVGSPDTHKWQAAYLVLQLERRIPPPRSSFKDQDLDDVVKALEYLLDHPQNDLGQFIDTAIDVLYRQICWGAVASWKENLVSCLCKILNCSSCSEKSR
jgi:hypothetical protein